MVTTTPWLTAGQAIEISVIGLALVGLGVFLLWLRGE